MTSDERLSTLDQVVPLLGMAYTEWKAQEALKDEYRDAFFGLADEKLRRDGLAIRLVEMKASDKETAQARIERHNPGWEIQEIRPHRVHQDLWEAVLGEVASLRPFVYEHDQVKYARSVRRGSTLVDDEWLAEADPDLYCDVTYQLPWGEVVMRPLDILDKDLLARLKKYIYSGTPKVALTKPTPVKEEE